MAISFPHRNSYSSGVQLFKLENNTWMSADSLLVGGAGHEKFGYSMSFALNGAMLAVGAPEYNNGSRYVNVYVNAGLLPQVDVCSNCN